MKADDFVATPDDLLPAIIAYSEALEGAGWRLRIEVFDLSYPRTPPVVAKRGQVTYIVEAQLRIDLAVVREWARFCKSQNKDTRLCVVLADETMPTTEQLDSFAELGVGLYVIGNGGPHELCPPKDLAMQFDPPEPPEKLKRILGEAYDHFGRGTWREGFEAAATAFEQEARKYLKLHVGRGRVTFVNTAGRAITYTNARIDKMTMGQLAAAFAEILTPNLDDTRIEQALRKVNDDRITVAHYKQVNAARERKLRKNVANHMFVIINGLSYIKGIR